MHEVLSFGAYYLCAVAFHTVRFVRHEHSLPQWAEKSRTHKIAAVTATVATAAGMEGTQGYIIHLIVYSGLFL